MNHLCPGLQERISSLMLGSRKFEFWPIWVSTFWHNPRFKLKIVLVIPGVRVAIWCNINIAPVINTDVNTSSFCTFTIFWVDNSVKMTVLYVIFPKRWTTMSWTSKGWNRENAALVFVLYFFFNKKNRDSFSQVPISPFVSQFVLFFFYFFFFRS